MKFISTIKYKLLSASLLLMLLNATTVSAQAVYQPYSFDFYQKFSSQLYSKDTRIHSTIKPTLLDDSLIKHTYDSLMAIGINTQNKNWGYRKLFAEHQLDVKSNGYTLYGDILPDLQIGRDFSGRKNYLAHYTGLPGWWHHRLKILLLWQRLQ